MIALIWLLTRMVATDSKQLENNVQAMADAVKAGKMDELFKHISRDFQYKTMTRDILYAKTQAAIRDYRITQVRITNFTVEELSREKKFARTSFRVSAWWDNNEHPYLFGTEADFVLEEEQWKVKTLRFYNPFVEQDREVDLPFPN